MKNILLTGSQGFIGKSLKASLLSSGNNIFEFTGDITKSSDLEDFLKAIPALDLTFHFAGMSSPPKCEEDKAAAHLINTQSAFEVAKQVSIRFPRSHFVFPSTGQVYSVTGSSEQSGITETSLVNPINYYAHTKLEAERLLQTLANERNFKTTVLRLFNHTHKSQDPTFFLPSLYKQIQEGSKSIKTGNLDLVRDFGAIQDLLTALSLLTTQVPNENFEIFNICSGTGKHLKTLAEELAAQMHSAVEWITDPSKIRKGEPESIIGSSAKFQSAFGWKPQAATNERKLIQSFLKDL